MTLQSLLVRDVTIRRAGTTTDRYGNVILNWSSVTNTAAKGWLSQTTESEDHESRTATITSWVLFLNAGADIEAFDRVVVGTRIFEVDGRPHRAWTPRGEHHIEARVVEVNG